MKAFEADRAAQLIPYGKSLALCKRHISAAFIILPVSSLLESSPRHDKHRAAERLRASPPRKKQFTTVNVRARYCTLYSKETGRKFVILPADARTSEPGRGGGAVICDLPTENGVYGSSWPKQQSRCVDS
jgi:hypothetical protein